MKKALWAILSPRYCPWFWQWADRVNFLDKLIIRNHMHHTAHEIGMKYFFNHPQYKYYMSSGDDSLATPDHLKLLLEDEEKHHFPIISGWASLDPSKNNLSNITVTPIHPAIIRTRKVRPYGYKFVPIKDLMQGKHGYPFVKAYYNGLGFSLIQREILKKTPIRPFKLQRDRLCITPETKRNGRGVMFDLQFAIDCAAKKIPITVDARIFFLHGKTKMLAQVGKKKPSVKLVKATEKT